jgi:RND family efflux transporter MFP subunit
MTSTFRRNLGSLLGVGVLTLASSLAWAQGAGPVPVEIGNASRQSMASTILAPGTVVSRNDARIAAEISGRLTWVAEVGQQIKQGEVIARIDDQAWKLQLLDNEATIKRLEANLEYLDRQLQRLQQLAQANNAAKDRLDESTAQKNMAEQDLVQARVAREQTLYQLERAQVRASFSGQIVQRMVQAGEYISQGGAIARLVDTMNIEVRAQAPMTVAPYLFDDMPVTVHDQSQHIQSRIRSVIPVGDERSRMIEVRVSLAASAWPIGSAVRVELPRGEAVEVVAVPRDALILRQDSVYLFRVGEDNVVEQVPVQTGVGHGELIEVRGNVNQGDKVVIRGGERLRAGQTVVIGQES